MSKNTNKIKQSSYCGYVTQNSEVLYSTKAPYVCYEEKSRMKSVD